MAIIIQISILLTSFCIFGLDIATRKLIPEFLKGKKKYRVNILIRFSIKIISSISLIVAFLIILFNRQLSSIFNLDYRVFFLISPMMIILIFYYYFGSILQGYQNMKKYFFTDLYGQIFKIILFYPLILMGFDYFGPAIAILISYLVSFLTRIDINFLKNISNKFHLNKLIFKYSFPAFIVTILLSLFNYTQYIILIFFSIFNLTTLQAMENIAYFALCITISTPTLVAINVLCAALFPITSELSMEKNSNYRQAYLIKLVLRYVFFLILPVSIFLILTSKYAILFFSKVEYLQATTILPFIIFASLFSGLGTLFVGSLYALKKPKLYRNIFAVAVIIYFILAFILTYYFYVYGLAVSYMTANLIFFILGVYFIKKYLFLKLPVYDFIKLIFCLFLSSIFYLFFSQLFHNIIAIIFLVVFSFIFYFVLLLKLNFYIEEDLKIIDFFIEKTPIFKEQIKYFRNFLSRFVKRSYY